MLWSDSIVALQGCLCKRLGMPVNIAGPLQVHKFGGTCVAAAERIRSAAQLIVDEPAQQKMVVVSAMGSHPSSPVKVTDLLLNMVAKASKQNQAFLIDLAALQVGTADPGC